jgi:hypothetical protein
MVDNATQNKLKLTIIYTKTLFDNWVSIIFTEAEIFLMNGILIKNYYTASNTKSISVSKYTS